MARSPSEAINLKALSAQSHSRLVKPSTHVPEALGPLTSTLVINKHCQNGDVFVCQTWRNNSRKNPRISKGGRKGPSRKQRARHLLVLACPFPSFPSQDFWSNWTCGCMCVVVQHVQRGYMQHVQYALTLRYIRVWWKSGGCCKVTLPVFTCVPALYSSFDQIINHNWSPCFRLWDMNTMCYSTVWFSTFF